MAVRTLQRVVVPARLEFAERMVARAGVLDEATAETLVAALAAVPREQFVSPSLAASAYDDVALPIGFGKELPRASEIARLGALIGLRSGMKVLDVACGCGYSSAVMAAAGAYVFALEYIGPLAQRTRRVLDSLSFANVIVRSGVGRRGWAEHAPFDAILVSSPFVEPAAENDSSHTELLRQLRPAGGRLVAPMQTAEGEFLYLWERKASGVHGYRLEPWRSGSKNDRLGS